MDIGKPMTAGHKRGRDEPKTIRNLRKKGRKQNSSASGQVTQGDCADNPINLDDDSDSTKELNHLWESSRQKKIIDSITGKPHCDDCGLCKEYIAGVSELLIPKLPKDGEEATRCVRAIQNSVKGPLDDPLASKIRKICERADSETRKIEDDATSEIRNILGLRAFDVQTTEDSTSSNRPCTTCGIDRQYILMLLVLAQQYLVRDDSLLDKLLHGQCNAEEACVVMTRLYINLIREHCLTVPGH